MLGLRSNKANLILSPGLQYELEAQAAREGVLTDEDYVFANLMPLHAGYGSGVVPRGILPLLCFFPTVTATNSEYILDGVSLKTGLGISHIDSRRIQVQSTIEGCGPGHGRIEIGAATGNDRFRIAVPMPEPLLDKFNFAESYYDIGKGSFLKVLAQAQDEAERICLSDSPGLTRMLLTLVNPSYGEHVTVLADSSLDTPQPSHIAGAFTTFLPDILDVYSGWYSNGLGAPLPFDYLTGQEWRAHREADTFADEFVASIFSHPLFEALVDKLDDYYVRLVASLFLANCENNTVGTRRWYRKRHGAKSLPNPDNAVETCQLLRVQFRDELTVVPDPRNLYEAIEYSSCPEIVRLGQLLDEWLQSARADNLSMECRIRRDITKASQDLKRLQRYREFKESPFVFGLRTVLGQVPIISNVVSVVEVGGWLWERHTQKRTCWVSLN
ncbi:MAG: hypothetical protein GEU87_05190 [Alphaproteobacteria bacterium]|nr:hypothetical protein [Alphaproteobacteria bacterium]